MPARKAAQAPPVSASTRPRRAAASKAPAATPLPKSISKTASAKASKRPSTLSAAKSGGKKGEEDFSTATYAKEFRFDSTYAAASIAIEIAQFTPPSQAGCRRSCQENHRGCSIGQRFRQRVRRARARGNRARHRSIIQANRCRRRRNVQPQRRRAQSDQATRRQNGENHRGSRRLQGQRAALCFPNVFLHEPTRRGVPADC